MLADPYLNPITPFRVVSVISFVTPLKVLQKFKYVVFISISTVLTKGINV